MTPENLSWLMTGAQLMMLIYMMAKCLQISKLGKEFKRELDKLKRMIANEN